MYCQIYITVYQWKKSTLPTVKWIREELGLNMANIELVSLQAYTKANMCTIFIYTPWCNLNSTKLLDIDNFLDLMINWGYVPHKKCNFEVVLKCWRWII